MRRHRVRTVVSTLAVALVALAGVTTAQAATTTTHWFTIDVKPPDAASPPRFLGIHDRFTAAAVELKRYESEHPTRRGEYSSWADLQWSPVIPEYPATPDVTGVGPGPADIINAFTCDQSGIPDTPATGGCNFSGHGGLPPMKFVNRGSGRCLSLSFTQTRSGNGTSVVADDCWRNRKAQIWQVAGNPNAALTGQYLNLQKQRPQNPNVDFCLDVRNHALALGTRLQIWGCHQVNNWNEQFRFLAVGESTCQLKTYESICGIRAKGPNSRGTDLPD